MENLFYSRSVTHKFDLKGSVRNRLVNPTAADRDGEIVLLDENLLNSKYDRHCGESVLANGHTPVGCGLDSPGSGWDCPVTGFCDHGNEPLGCSGALKCLKN
jgi:hypothetical protein